MRPETRAAYPPDWSEIARRIRQERGDRCERCGQDGDHLPGWTGKKFGGGNYLTVHHRDYNPANNDPFNLVVLCQACHLRVQARALPAYRERQRLETAGQQTLLKKEG